MQGVVVAAVVTVVALTETLFLERRPKLLKTKIEKDPFFSDWLDHLDLAWETQPCASQYGQSNGHTHRRQGIVD